MHIIFNEDHYLDNTSVPIDLNQEPADLVILSFSDSDLNAFANAWKKTLVDFGRESVPTLRLANIKQLTHNLSICLLYTSPSPRDRSSSRMPSSA